jgi:hypothetical protein
MKFAASKLLFGIVTLLTLVFIFYFGLGIRESRVNPSDSTTTQIIAVLGVVYCLTVLRFDFSIITIGEDGVTAKALGLDRGGIPWDEMGEVGISVRNFGFTKLKMVYFSRHRLTPQERSTVMRMKQNEDGMWITYSEKVIEEVKKHYHKDIAYLNNI